MIDTNRENFQIPPDRILRSKAKSSGGDLHLKGYGGYGIGMLVVGFSGAEAVGNHHVRKYRFMTGKKSWCFAEQ